MCNSCEKFRKKMFDLILHFSRTFATREYQKYIRTGRSTYRRSSLSFFFIYEKSAGFLKIILRRPLWKQRLDFFCNRMLCYRIWIRVSPRAHFQILYYIVQILQYISYIDLILRYKIFLTNDSLFFLVTSIIS